MAARSDRPKVKGRTPDQVLGSHRTGIHNRQELDTLSSQLWVVQGPLLVTRLAPLLPKSKVAGLLVLRLIRTVTRATGMADHKCRRHRRRRAAVHVARTRS